MFMVLDGLKSDDPQILRTSETWMRCNLRYYFRYAQSLTLLTGRMVDPLLRLIMDIMAQSKGEAPLRDPSLLQYYVSSATSLFRFGGQGLSKASQATDVHKSSNAMFVNRVDELFPEAVTYLDLITDILIS